MVRTRADRTSLLLWLALITTVLMAVLCAPLPVDLAASVHGSSGLRLGVPTCEAKPAGLPRTFNLYIRKHYEPGDDILLAKWDVLGLDMDTPDSMLVLIKAANPNCKLLAFCPINGTYDQAMRFPANSKWRLIFETAAANNWWLRNTNGGQVKDHGNKFTTNLTLNCPKNAQNQTIHDWFLGFVNNTLLQNGASLWDGVILDDCWVGIWWVSIDTWLNPYPIDSNGDHIADAQSVLDQSWAAGNDTLLARLRRTMPPNKILTGNGQNHWYQLNGAMIETFPFGNNPDPGSPASYSWNYTMFQDYGYFSNEDHYNNNPQRMNFLNAKWSIGSRYTSNQSPEYQRHKRFCLASTMLRNGYFSLDWSSNGVAHNSLWWEPEYDKPIGTPLGAPYQATYQGQTVWRRDFTNGSVVLNPNYTSFGGSPPDSLPPIGYLDAAIMLRTEFWHPDVTPPPPLVDLSVASSWPDSIMLQWTNVADDRPTSRVTNMSVRYSLAPITDSNFYQASRVFPPPVPGPPGTTQTVTIRELTPNTTYFLAVRVWDEFGNGSPMSNVTSGITVLSDLTPPASAHLEFNSVGLNEASYSFLMPGDDGMVGLPQLLDMRYSTTPLNETTWLQATRITDLPPPGYSSVRQKGKVRGLTPATTYYFALRALDDASNWSALEPRTIRTAVPGTVKRGPYNDSDDLPLPRMAAEIGVDRYMALSAPQPNPTRGLSRVSLLVPEAGVVEASVTVFDSRGRQIALLHSGPLGAGRQDFEWSGLDAGGMPQPAGVYFVSLRAGEFSDVKKVVRNR